MGRFLQVSLHLCIYLKIKLEEQLIPGMLPFAIYHIIEKLDLSCFEKKYKNDKTGRLAIPPKVLLKVVLMAYSHGILHSRDMEFVCKTNALFIAISGNLRPDHTTIATFISSMDEESQDVFCQVLAICYLQGLIGGEIFALDGVKLPSNAAKEWSGTFPKLKKKMEKFQKTIEYLKGLHDPNAQPGALFDKSKAIEHLNADIEKIRAFLESNEPKIGAQGKEIQSNITDNDSAKMLTSHGYIQGYNAQALADDLHQVVIHTHASGNGQDYEHLDPVITEAKKTMTAITGFDDYFQRLKFLSDTNYFSDYNLTFAEAEGIDAYIPDHQFRQRDERFQTAHEHKPEVKNKKFTLEDFPYNSEKDIFTCPKGIILKRNCVSATQGDRKYRVYRSPEKSCVDCPLRKQCIHNPSAKRKNLWIPLEQKESDKNLCQKMRDKIDTPEGRQIYALRMKIIEPVFGNIAYNKGMDRFTLRGDKKVNIQWRLYNLVHNIEKICHYGDVVKYVNEH